MVVMAFEIIRYTYLYSIFGGVWSRVNHAWHMIQAINWMKDWYGWNIYVGVGIVWIREKDKTFPARCTIVLKPQQTHQRLQHKTTSQTFAFKNWQQWAEIDLWKMSTEWNNQSKMLTKKSTLTIWQNSKSVE